MSSDSKSRPARQNLWRWRLQRFDYDGLLPLIARLPVRVGSWVAHARGRFNAWANRDWTELSVGFPYVKDRTVKVSALLWPKLDPHVLGVERYKSIAREEWHAALIQAGRLDQLKIDLSELEKCLMSRQRDRGLVVLTAHFDSFILGMVGLGLCGEKVSVTTSNVYQSSLVHPSVTKFFERKYREAEKYFGSGAGFVIVEKSMKHFYKALRRCETVVVVADAPSGEIGRGIWLPWFGQQRQLAEGGIRLALETQSQICAMLCITQSDGSLNWLCSGILDPKIEPQLAEKLYGYLEEQIIRHPGRWWASHLLEDYPTIGS